MQQITETDRGTFLVTTRSGTEHTWVITDEGVTVQRKSSGNNHWSMDAFTTQPYAATVKTWPEVGGCFLNMVNGGAGDTPWTRSSTVQSIERLA